MANGSRGKGGGKRSEETRAGSLAEDEREYARRARSNETRVAPVVEDEEPETLPPASAGESNRTMFASHAALFADRLRERFAQKRYGRAPHLRVLRIDEPEGPSTAGGRLARQPLSSSPGAARHPPSSAAGWTSPGKRPSCAAMSPWRGATRPTMARRWI
ncbi:hypothetical protein ACN28S_11215 [Cystobacter fuscus]